jgi:hypothetical protein
MTLITALLQTGKDIGPFAVSVGTLGVSVAVFFVTHSFNKWQQELAKQSLRHQLYDRRWAIYVVFRELMEALPGKADDEIKAVFRKANFALLEIPFLFEDDPDLQAYLGQLCTQVTDVVISETDLNTKNEDALYSAYVLYDHGNQRAHEFRERKKQYSAAKRKIHDEYLQQLPKKFGPFLNLTDFSKRRNRCGLKIT